MSIDFFGFKGEPFSVHPDNKYFFSSISHDKAITLLEYGINSRKGVMLLTGLKGTGKTMTCSFLRESLNNVNTSVVSCAAKEPEKLLAEICGNFGIEFTAESPQEAFGKLIQFFVEQYKDGKNSLIIIDDAEDIPDATLTMLNSFMEIEIEQCKLVQVILCGTPALHDRLKNISSQLGPKFTFTVELAALSMKDTVDYVEHRLRTAFGDNFPLFKKNAYMEIYHYSKGIPSEINRVAQKAIEIAGDKSSSRVTPANVRQAAAVLYGVSRGKPFKALPVLAGGLLLIVAIIFFLKPNQQQVVVKSDMPTVETSSTDKEQTSPAEEIQTDLKPNQSEINNEEPIKTSEPEPVKPEPVVPETPKFGCVDASSGLKLRQTPSRNAPSVGNAPNRAKVELISRTESGEWWKVRYKGKEGYMFAEFVKPSESGECGR